MGSRARLNLILHLAAAFAMLIACDPTAAQTQSPQTSPAPNLSMSGNGSTVAQTYQGWALIFQVTLAHPMRASRSTGFTPLLINPLNGSWANAVQLVVTDSNGVVENWPMHLIAAPAGPLTLDVSSIGQLVWTVAPSDTASIAPGTYTAIGILDTTASAGASGWSGVTNSYAISVQVSSPPSPATSDQQEEQFELLAMYDQLTGNSNQALSDIGSLLAQQPNSVGALALKGSLLEQMGQTQSALSAYDQAVAAFNAANPGPSPEPPRNLLIPQHRLRAAVLSQSGVRGQPNISVSLLGQGVQSPGVIFLDLQFTNSGSDVAENVLLSQLSFATLSGTGQAAFNNALSAPLPIFSDFLSVNNTATVRIFVNLLGTVNTFSVTETGTAADIFGTPVSFTATQTITADSTAGGTLLTITAGSATQQYGQPTAALNNVTYSGFVNGDTPTSLNGTLNCTATATQASPVGTYPITCSGLSSPNYVIDFVPGTLTVRPAPLILTANSSVRLYGAANPPLNFVTASGLVNGDSVGSLGGTLNCSTTATPASPVGTYPITCSGLSSTNYSITFAAGQLTVGPSPLSIIANNAARAYGVANPPLNNITSTGFVNGDTLASLNGSLICSTTATQTSTAGMYPITCSGLSSPNYSITYVPGTLSVTSDALTITANSVARQYGQTNPALNNVAYAGFVNGDTPATLAGTLTCTAPATQASPAGTYPITCSGLTSTSYAISFAPGVLTITPAPLMVAAGSTSRRYGANNPALNGMISGLQNGDPIAANFTTTAVPASPVGMYPITAMVSDPSNRLGNYTLSLVNGSLSIVQETTTLGLAVSPTSIPVGQSATVTVTLTAPDMVIAIPNDSTVLAPITVTSPSFPSDILSNNGVCAPLPSSIPGVASCTVTVTSLEPNGRTLNANFAGSADLVASSGTGNLIVTAALQGKQSCIRSDFRNVAVSGGNYLWFNSIFKVRDVSKQLIHISFFNSTAQFQYTDASGNLASVNQGMPDAHITIDPNATAASTSFDPFNNVWTTTIPWDLDDNSFLTGMPWLVPAAGLPKDVEPVTVCGTFASDVVGIEIGWRWSAAAYSSFSGDITVLGVKPMNTDHDNPPANRDNAGTPENFKGSVIPGARGKGGKNYTGSYSGSAEIE